MAGKKYWSWWLYFFSKRELLVLKTGRSTSVNATFCFVKICFQKKGDKYKVSWLNRSSLKSIRIQHKVVFLFVLIVFAVGF